MRCNHSPKYKCHLCRGHSSNCTCTFCSHGLSHYVPEDIGSYLDDKETANEQISNADVDRLIQSVSLPNEKKSLWQRLFGKT